MRSFILLLIFFLSYQDNLKHCRSIDDALKNPSSVQSIRVRANNATKINLDRLFSNAHKFINLSKLTIHFGQINTVPTAIADMQKLEELHITNSPIIKFAKGLDNTNIKNIILTENYSLKHLPIEICKIKNLERLYVHFCGLEHLPSEVNLLKNLKELDVSENGISSIPKLHNLKKLEYLGLANNNISHITSVVKGLKNLIRIDLRYTSIPKEEIILLHSMFPDAEILY